MSEFKVFLIMPFDSELNDLYYYIKDTIETIGKSFKVFRADNLLNQQNILKDIVESIHISNLIIADLTGLNPNVFYELGLAHALRKNVILLTQDISEIPFDLRSYRVIQYSTHFSKIMDLGNTLKRLIDEIKNGVCTFGNPVTDWLLTNNNNIISKESVHTLPIATETLEQHSNQDSQDSVVEDINEKGLIDFIADIEESMEKLTSLLELFSTKTEDIGNVTNQTTEDISKAWNNPSSGTASHVRKLSRKLSNNLNDYGNFLSQTNKEYEELWNIFEESLANLIVRPLIGQSKENLQGFNQFLTTLAEAKESVIGTKDGMIGMQESVASIKGYESSITRAAALIEREIKTYIGLLDKSIATLDRSIIFGNIQVNKYLKQ